MTRKFKLLKEIVGLHFKVGTIIETSYEKIGYLTSTAYDSTITYDPATRPDLWEEIKESIKKQYKLIKEYPGSPKLNTIATNSCDITYCSNGEYHHKNVIENNPEFWQKVEEKDYEILKTKYFEGRGEEIISVRRKDGEIFSVGDKTDKGIITEIILHPVLEVFGIKTDLHNCWNGSKTFNKLKQKLFTTEDNVDIFEGDKFFTVDIKTFKIWNNYFMKGYINYKYFSTKEKAEDWIYNNKPRFSFEDVEKAYYNACIDEKFDTQPCLSKLNQSLEKYCL